MKQITFLITVFLFLQNTLFSQLNVKVKVESISVQNSLNCDGGSGNNSDFLVEYKATDNSIAQLTNNTPVAGSIGNCNFAYLNESNGPYTVNTNTPGLAVFSPTTGVFFDHSYTCFQNIPTAISLTWRGYENDDSSYPSTTPVAGGITAINTFTVALPSNVTNTVLTVQYSATSPDLACDQTYIIKFSISISTGTFYPLFIEHTHENVICPGGTNGSVEVHVGGGSGTVLVDWSNDGTGDFNDATLINGLPAGSYTVVIKDGLNCTDTAVAVVTTTPAPIPITGFLQSKSAICNGSSAIFEVPTQANASDFLWVYSGIGASFSSTSSNSVSIAFSGTATSGVLSVSAVNSCSTSASLTLSLTISPVPNLSIYGNNTVCDNDNATILTATGALTYTWNNSATTASIIVTPTALTVYSVIASNNGCNTTGSYSVTVVQSPTVITSVSATSVCPNQTVTLTANGNGNLFLWSDGYVGSVHTVTINSNVIYTVTNTYTNSCYAQSAISIYTKAVPSVSVSGNAFACPNKSIAITATGADAYVWSNGSINASITYTPVGLETFTVVGTNTVTGCTSASTINVSNYPAGTVTITGNPNLCSGVPTTYVASGSNFYLWNNGATAATNTVLATGPTTLQVVSTTVDGCKDSTTFALNITQTPTVTLSAVESVCAGQSTVLLANVSGATSYSWSTGASTTSITVAPISMVIYSFTASAGGCNIIATHTLSIKPIPLINFVVNSTICSSEQPIALNATPSGGIYNGVSIVGNVFNPNVGVGVYPITYFVTGSNGCTASSSQTINVVYCVGIEEFDEEITMALFPNPVINAFTVVSSSEINTLEVVDFTGKLIVSEKIRAFEKTIFVDDLKAGLYICRLSSQAGIQKILRFQKL